MSSKTLLLTAWWAPFVAFLLAPVWLLPLALLGVPEDLLFLIFYCFAPVSVAWLTMVIAVKYWKFTRLDRPYLFVNRGLSTGACLGAFIGAGMVVYGVAIGRTTVESLRFTFHGGFLWTVICTALFMFLVGPVIAHYEYIRSQRECTDD